MSQITVSCKIDLRPDENVGEGATSDETVSSTEHKLWSCIKPNSKKSLLPLVGLWSNLVIVGQDCKNKSVIWKMPRDELEGYSLILSLCQTEASNWIRITLRLRTPYCHQVLSARMVETHPRKLPNDDKVEIQQQSEKRKLNRYYRSVWTHQSLVTLRNCR